MKRRIKIDNLISGDRLAIFGKDWITNVMGGNKYYHLLVNTIIDDPKDFEIELELDRCEKDAILRVRQEFYVPIELTVSLEHENIDISLNRISDPVY